MRLIGAFILLPFAIYMTIITMLTALAMGVLGLPIFIGMSLLMEDDILETYRFIFIDFGLFPVKMFADYTDTVL